MPNGTPTEERDWANWRGKVTAMLEEGQRWMAEHERKEFDHHARVETYMIDTARWIEKSSQHRADMAERLGKVEEDVSDATDEIARVDLDLQALKSRLNMIGLLGAICFLPLAGWALIQIIEHMAH